MPKRPSHLGKPGFLVVGACDQIIRIYESLIEREGNRELAEALGKFREWQTSAVVALLKGTWRAEFKLGDLLFGVPMVVVVSFHADGTYSQVTQTWVMGMPFPETDAGRWTYEGGVLTTKNFLGVARDSIVWSSQIQFQATCLQSPIPMIAGIKMTFTRVQ
jgi:hypothetical protein